MAPAIDANIPIYIRNTFEPSHPGTRIYLSPGKGESVRERAVCGFTTVDHVSLLNIEGKLNSLLLLLVQLIYHCYYFITIIFCLFSIQALV